ncbi:MAG: hypothetical protein LBD88_00675 [Candidatus Peribacteria bacterium]|jgi:muramidase (phage lysozyme)|nr:hypothetical protein [Candidatus Peribacteria bacterium]
MEPIKNLLDIIAAAELPPSHINNYNVMFGMNDTEKPTFQPTVYMLTEYEPLKNKKLTDMTIGEVMQVQEDFRNKQIELKYKPTTTAMGRYQFMKSTLTSLTSPPFNVNKDLKFSPETQDKLAILLLSDAGVGK